MHDPLGSCKGGDTQILAAMNKDSTENISWDEFLDFFGQQLND